MFARRLVWTEMATLALFAVVAVAIFLPTGATAGSSASAASRPSAGTPVVASASSAIPTPGATVSAPPASEPALNPVALPVRSPLDPNIPNGTWERLDVSLDASLAATLAGLAAAIATFLLGASAPLFGDVQKIRDLGGTATCDQRKRLADIHATVNDLLNAFYCFVGMLVETLTLDHWEAPGAILDGNLIASYADVLLGGALLSAGLYFLGSGTRALRALLLEPGSTQRS
jgi:hypothetical protein